MSNKNKPLMAAMHNVFESDTQMIHIGYEGDNLAHANVLTVVGSRAKELRALFAEADCLGKVVNTREGACLSLELLPQCVPVLITPSELPYRITDRGAYVRNRYLVTDPEGLELCVTMDYTCAQAVWSLFLHGHELGFGLWSDEDTKRYLAKKEAIQAAMEAAVEERLTKHWEK